MKTFPRLALFTVVSVLSISAFAASTRIHFKPGSHRLSLVGHLSRRAPSHGYLLHASRGSRLSIDAEGRHGLAVMYHIVFPSGKTFGQKGYDPFDGRLTETGNYQIVVEVNQMATIATSGSYRLALKR